MWIEILSSKPPGGKLSAQEYVLGVKEAMRYGAYNYPIQHLSDRGFAAELTPEQRKIMYNLGKAEAIYDTAEKQKAVDAKGIEKQTAPLYNEAGRSEITDGENAALLSYKSGGSYLLNAKLREEMALDESEQETAGQLDRALSKLPAYEGRVYRNISFDGLGDGPARDAFVAEHVIGKTVTYDAYTSTSTAADGYPIDGDYVVHFEIEGRTGRNMDGYGNNSESEILFARQTRFFVDKIEYAEDGTPTIYLTEAQKHDEGRNLQGYDRGDHKGKSRPSDYEAQMDTVRSLQKANAEQGNLSVISGHDSGRSLGGNKTGLQGLRGEVSRKGSVHFDRTGKVLTARQETSLKALGFIADTLGVDIHVFESQTGENGRRIGENGRYDPKTGDIYVDLFAGNDGEGLMLFTASHELTHFIRQWSPVKFKAFADFLMEQYGEAGVSADELVFRQQEKAKKNGRTLTYDEAFEEMAADSCESFLADRDVLEKLRTLKAKDKSLFERVKDFVSRLYAKIKAAYSGTKPDSAEGRIVAGMNGSLERLHELFAEAAADAGKAYAAAGMKTAADKMSAAEGNAKYSARAVDSEGNELSPEQADFFKGSHARLDDDGTFWYGEGNLACLYHETDSEFTVFDKSLLGKTTDGNAADKYLESTAHVGFWFNTNDIRRDKTDGRVIQAYLNIKRPYDAGSLDGLCGDIWDNSDEETSPKEAGESFVEMLEWKGYDGIVLEDTEFGGISFIAFYPEQIKLTSNTAPTEDEDIRYSIRDTDDGRKFVSVDEDILDGVPRKQWRKTIVNNMRDKFNYVQLGKNRILIDRQSRNEMSLSRQTQKYLTSDKQKFADKYRTTNNADELVIATTNYVNESPKHARKDDIVDFCRGKVLIRIGGRSYEADTIFAHRKNGATLLYDFINLTPVSFTEKKTDDAKTSTSQDEKSIGAHHPSTTSIRDSSQNVNTPHQDRESSGRAALADALLQAAQNDAEKRLLTKYKAEAETLDAQSGRLEALNKELSSLNKRIGEQRKTLKAAPGREKAAAQAELSQLLAERNRVRDEAVKTANRITVQDGKLLRLEAGKPLKELLQRERKAAAEKMRIRKNEQMEEERRALTAHYKEQKAKSMDVRRRAELRGKIRREVSNLNSLLLHGTKEKHVNDNLKKVVAQSLELFNSAVLKGTENRIQTTVNETALTGAYNTREKLLRFQEAYRSITESDDPIIAGAHDETVEGLIADAVKLCGDTAFIDMNETQLDALHTMYKSVFTTLKNADKLFKAERNASVSEASLAVAGRLFTDVIRLTQVYDSSRTPYEVRPRGTTLFQTHIKSTRSLTWCFLCFTK